MGGTRPGARQSPKFVENTAISHLATDICDSSGRVRYWWVQMNQLTAAIRGLDYAPYEFGGAPLLLRGPRKVPEGDYVAMLGGSETYGKYVSYPFPDLVEGVTGVTVMNCGVMNAGIGAFSGEENVAALCRGAKATVIQVLGAQNMSSPLYSVHPRRNDRVLGAKPALKALYGGLDLTEVHFTRHLMNKLRRLSDDAFAQVRETLRDAWMARMKQLLEAIDGEVILLLLTIYPISRFLLETIRIDEDPIFGTGLSISQNVSIGIFILAVLAWPLLLRQQANVQARPELAGAESPAPLSESA